MLAALAIFERDDSDEGDGVGAFAGDETGVRRMSAYDRLVAELSMSTVGESGVSSMAGG